MGGKIKGDDFVVCLIELERCAGLRVLHKHLLQLVAGGTQGNPEMRCHELTVLLERVDPVVA